MPVRMLIVDDDQTVLTSLERIIRYTFGESLSLTVMSNSLIASEWIPLNRPDIVVTDFDMPQIDGASLSDVVKTHNPDARVIVYSGSREACELCCQNDRVVDVFVSKSRGLRDLVSVLSDVLLDQYNSPR